jgi:tRNA1(Val) A37 N6-methylase TrmN6
MPIAITPASHPPDKASDGLAAHSALKKAHGVHYTPPLLAAFLAQNVVRLLAKRDNQQTEIAILDPACGDGELLRAVFDAVPSEWQERLSLTGFDKDETALEQATTKLAKLPIASVKFQCGDFLAAVPAADFADQQSRLDLFGGFAHRTVLESRFDAIISNPPYVRTQVLGSAIARSLAARYELSGRVDLYHAFVKAMTMVLRTGGILGLLTSNRFLTVQSGTSTREWLARHFKLLQLVDLGDTKLFEAAVLPAVLIAERCDGVEPQECEFIRIYESAQPMSVSREERSVFDALDGSFSGSLRVNGVSFKVETGQLQTDCNSRAPWSLTNRGINSWLATVKAHAAASFADVAKICVGIKTTADAVFVRDNWETLPENERPEAELLHPLVTHHIAARWHLSDNGSAGKRVLYPYLLSAEERAPINLEEFPRARAYLQKNRAQLTNRKYVAESGREWFEIWVPHRPKDWSRTKLAFPDISESSRFFVVEDGWIVNGDCYWTKLLPGKDDYWLMLMLAVANSSFALEFYDTVFHNKLYSGRRRFMSQYVSRFPLPKLNRARDILDLMPSLLSLAAKGHSPELANMEQQLNRLVWQAFGLSEEVHR